MWGVPLACSYPPSHCARTRKEGVHGCRQRVGVREALAVLLHSRGAYSAFFFFLSFLAPTGVAEPYICFMSSCVHTSLVGAVAQYLE